MRGKRLAETAHPATARIIPAHAGQTASNGRSGVIVADHPRACGANTMLPDMSGVPCGSSPRMRGKQVMTCRLACCGRIIPAHAGQTWPRGYFVGFPSDHPRACGANAVLRRWRTPPTGSSPRMRGKRCVGHVQHPWPRIIPAHAGQTCSRGAKARPTPDHPRACGANCFAATLCERPAGSSPRMRGKRRLQCGERSGVRIIPAHAGQTSVAFRSSLRLSDHPRACGANALLRRVQRSIDGSSPRMRGKRRGRPIRARILRIIPAHAGQTTSR